MDFRSDNVASVAEEIMAAIASANTGTAAGYGDDDISQGLHPAYSELFETEVRVFPVLTGTIANALSASVLSPPWGAIYAEADSHIAQDECGAPELFTGGAKLIALEGRNGKIPPEVLRRRLATAGKGFVHAVDEAKPTAVMAATPFHVNIEQLGLESEARLLSIEVEGGRLVLHIQNGVADGRVLIIDINSGAVLGEIALPPPLQ